MSLTAIPSLQASFFFNPKLTRNVSYALQTTSPNFSHFLIFSTCGLGPNDGAKIKVQVQARL